MVPSVYQSLDSQSGKCFQSLKMLLNNNEKGADSQEKKEKGLTLFLLTIIFAYSIVRERRLEEIIMYQTYHFRRRLKLFLSILFPS